MVLPVFSFRILVDYLQHLLGAYAFQEMLALMISLCVCYESHHPVIQPLTDINQAPVGARTVPGILPTMTWFFFMGVHIIASSQHQVLMYSPLQIIIIDTSRLTVSIGA